MSRFGDRRTEDVFYRRLVRGVPQEITEKSARKLDRVYAATTFDNIHRAGRAGRMARGRDQSPPRFFLHVEAHWWIGFEWVPTGAYDICLEERR